MKISTKRAAREMAIKAPEARDLDFIKKVIPNPSEFPYPTPEEVASKTRELKRNSDYDEQPSNGLFQLLTGQKYRGYGIALASYPRIYDKAIRPLEELWSRKDEPRAMVDYLLANPIQYKASKDPLDPELRNPETGELDEKEFASRCITNLMEWLYLSSCPAYQYLREQLLEKARFLRKKIAEAFTGITRVFPQRPTTSRSMGENETQLWKVNAGYKVETVEDPFEDRMTTILKLVTWFFTDSKTHKKVFVDFFDIINGDLDEALRKMRRSKLYYSWAAKMSPKEYAAACGPFQLSEAEIGENLEGLTMLTGEM